MNFQWDSCYLKFLPYNGLLFLSSFKCTLSIMTKCDNEIGCWTQLLFCTMLMKYSYAHLVLSQFLKTVSIQAWSFSILYAGSYINLRDERVCKQESEKSNKRRVGEAGHIILSLCLKPMGAALTKVQVYINATYIRTLCHGTVN